MKIEAGKYYQTRDGRTAHIVAIRTDLDETDYPVVGYVCGRGGVECWCLDGSFYSTGEGGPTDASDLVELVEGPPKPLVFWLNILSEHMGMPAKVQGPYISQAAANAANNAADAPRLDCLEVVWQNGELGAEVTSHAVGTTETD